MKIKHIWFFIISGFSSVIWAQSPKTETLDSLNKQPKTYALRVGVDASRLLKTQLNSDFSGIELVGDLQLGKRLFVAAELGTEKIEQQSELIHYTTKGNYLKLGIDYNIFNNWEGMDNVLAVGLRFASSGHRHAVNQYELYTTHRYFDNPIITQGFEVGEKSAISTRWIELLFGVKVELLQNLYAGMSLRLHILAKRPEVNNYGNIYAPGFNRITDDNSFGSSFNYTLMYKFPFRFRKN